MSILGLCCTSVALSALGRCQLQAISQLCQTTLVWLRSVAVCTPPGFLSCLISFPFRTASTARAWASIIPIPFRSGHCVPGPGQKPASPKSSQHERSAIRMGLGRTGHFSLGTPPPLSLQKEQRIQLGRVALLLSALLVTPLSHL